MSGCGPALSALSTAQASQRANRSTGALVPQPRRAVTLPEASNIRHLASASVINKTASPESTPTRQKSTPVRAR